MKGQWSKMVRKNPEVRFADADLKGKKAGLGHECEVPCPVIQLTKERNPKDRAKRHPATISMWRPADAYTHKKGGCLWQWTIYIKSFFRNDPGPYSIWSITCIFLLFRMMPAFWSKLGWMRFSSASGLATVHHRSAPSGHLFESWEGVGDEDHASRRSQGGRCCLFFGVFLFFECDAGFLLRNNIEWASEREVSIFLVWIWFTRSPVGLCCIDPNGIRGGGGVGIEVSWVNGFEWWMSITTMLTWMIMMMTTMMMTTTMMIFERGHHSTPHSTPDCKSFLSKKILVGVAMRRRQPGCQESHSPFERDVARSSCQQLKRTKMGVPRCFRWGFTITSFTLWEGRGQLSANCLPSKRMAQDTKSRDNLYVRGLPLDVTKASVSKDLPKQPPNLPTKPCHSILLLAYYKLDIHLAIVGYFSGNSVTGRLVPTLPGELRRNLCALWCGEALQDSSTSQQSSGYGRLGAGGFWSFCITPGIQGQVPPKKTIGFCFWLIYVGFWMFFVGFWWLLVVFWWLLVGSWIFFHVSRWPRRSKRLMP